jgi:hypothetical protein
MHRFVTGEIVNNSLRINAFSREFECDYSCVLMPKVPNNVEVSVRKLVPAKYCLLEFEGSTGSNSDNSHDDDRGHPDCWDDITG